MKKMYLILAALGFFLLSKGQNGIYVPEFTQCDDSVQKFMSDFNVPGLTFAMAKDEKLIYMRSFGYIDENYTQPTQPHNLFRVASLSKSITSIAIMKLMEEGKLSLSDHVFGSFGILNSAYYSSAISDNRIYDITVEHLLEHEGGWNRDINCVDNQNSPYDFNIWGCDPTFFPLYVSQETNESNPASKKAVIKFALQKGLDFTPGSAEVYSNLGYIILGKVIEAVSGMGYEDYIKTNILDPIGAYDMHIGGTLKEELLSRESEYIQNTSLTWSCYGDGNKVPMQYGQFYLKGSESAGGWIASARDLLRLITAVDGFGTRPDILSQATINTMVAPSTTNPGYAKGWEVNTANNWWHFGSLDGTSSFHCRAANGYTWVIIMNHREFSQGSCDYTKFHCRLDQLPWGCIQTSSGTPSHDLFNFPQTNSSNLQFSNVQSGSTTISFNKGDGDKRLVVVRENQPIENVPLDGYNYSASLNFGWGSNIGNNTYVVYKGSGNSFTLSNLNSEKTYYVKVYEYNDSYISGNHELYMIPFAPEGSFTTQAQSCLYAPWRRHQHYFANDMVSHNNQSWKARWYSYNEEPGYTHPQYGPWINLGSCVTQSLSTEIENTTNSEEVEIFPIPFNNTITILVGENTSYKTAQFYDVSGKLVSTFSVNGRKTELNLSELKRGVYNLRLIGERELMNRTVIKE